MIVGLGSLGVYGYLSRFRGFMIYEFMSLNPHNIVLL